VVRRSPQRVGGGVFGRPVAAAVCADYRRKLRYASAETLRGRQDEDAHELAKDAHEFAGEASVGLYRCEVDAAGAATFVNLQ